MKKIKMLISAFLILGMVCTGFCTFASETAKSDNEYENAYTLLSTLKIVTEKVSAEDTVTRGYFAEMTSRILRPEVERYMGGTFGDVSAATQYSEAIIYLKNLGIIEGDGTNFYPERDITYDEAVHILISALGYKQYAALKGVYPYGSREIARSISLGKRSEGTNRFYDILPLIKDALSAPMAVPTSVSDGETDYRGDKSETLLDKYFDIDIKEGVLITDGIRSVNPLKTAVRGKITVDDESFNYAQRLNIYAGLNVECYHYIRGAKEGTAACVLPTKDNDVLAVSADDIDRFENMTYYYHNESDRIKKAALNTQTTIIFNDKTDESYSAEKMMPKEGEVTLIDNDNDGKYDICYVMSQISMPVKTVIFENNGDATVYAVLGSYGKPVEISADDTVICDKNGKEITASDITAGSVISIIGREGTATLEAYEIIVSKERVNGDLTAMDTGEDASVYVDGKEYKVNRYCDTSAFNMQANLIFLLDYKGKICGLDADSYGGMAYGYLVDAYTTKNDKHKNVTVLEIYSELGKLVKYETADKVRVDDEVYTINGRETLVELLSNAGKVNNQVIRYDVNSDKEINRIDLYEDLQNKTAQTVSNRLYRTYPMTSLYYKKSTKAFSDRVRMDGNTVIFRVPQTPKTAAEKDFSVITVNDISSDGRYMVEAYTSNPDSLVADACIIRYNYSDFPSSATPVIVKKIVSAVNSEEELTYAVTVDGMKGELTLTASDASVVDKAHSSIASDNKEYKLGVGDIIKYILDGNGEIERINIIYRTATLESFGTTTASLGNVFNSNRIALVSVYDKDDRFIAVTSTDLSDMTVSDRLSFADCEIYEIAAFRIIVIEKDGIKTTFKNGSAADIEAFRIGGNASKVIIYTDSGEERAMFVIKE